MRRLLLIVPALALVLAFAADALAQQQLFTPELLSQALKLYPEADANGDGELSRQEAVAYYQKLRAEGKAPKLPAVETQQPQGRVTPTRADVSYGPHAANLLDFWQAESKEPTPLVVFIHGGGFRNGDKRGVSGTLIEQLRDEGVSFTSLNYRFRDEAPVQDILRDCARAIQYLRHNAEEFNIDPARIACMGGSAGAGTSLWLATHDDLADPDSSDPVLRQSTRIAAAVCNNGQATYNLLRWPEVMKMDVQQYERDPTEALLFYGLENEEELESAAGQAILADLDMLALVSADDPPLLFTCNQANEEPTNRGHMVHHPRHAYAVQEECQKVGVPCEVALVGKEGRDGANNRSVPFLLEVLGVAKKAKSEPQP